MKNILFTLSTTRTHENLFFISKILFSHSLIPTTHDITNKFFIYYLFIYLFLLFSGYHLPPQHAQKFPSLLQKQTLDFSCLSHYEAPPSWRKCRKIYWLMLIFHFLKEINCTYKEKSGVK